jgi:F-box interacting protein
MTAAIPRKKKHDGGVSLPEDIVFDVLARVPAKALCRFRCVCKGWRAVISDPAFVAAQRFHAGPYLVGVFYGAWWPPKVRAMDMEGNVIRVLEVRVLGKDDGTNVLVVLQLATTRFDLICANNAFIDPAAGRACTIGMDTRLAAPSFGRTTLSGTLKVIFLEDALPSQICKVATIVEGGAQPLTWRQKSAPPFLTTWHSKKRATVNGIVYFMPRLGLNEHYAAGNSGSNRIAAFDLESEEWKIINGPTFGVHAETWQVSLTELKGTLGVVHCLRNDDHSYANIWLLIDFDKSVWVKEYTIKMPKTWGLTKQLGALDDGRVLLLVSEENKVSYPRVEFFLYSTTLTQRHLQSSWTQQVIYWSCTLEASYHDK